MNLNKIKKGQEKINNIIRLVTENIERKNETSALYNLCLNFELEMRKFVSDIESYCNYSLSEANESLNLEITVNIKKNHLKIICPSLLPYRGVASVTSIRTVKLAYQKAIENTLIKNDKNLSSLKKSGFIDKNKRKNAVIYYTHFFDKNSSVKDADNIETKFMTDIIVPFICNDDSLKCLTLVNIGKVEEKHYPHTEIDIYIGKK